MIEVADLTYRYTGDKQALAGISFAVEPGEIFGFLGPNGSGKSTTQKILTGILTGYAGRARVLGREISDWGREVYHRIGVLFELPYLYSALSAVDNLRYFSSFYRRGSRRDVEELLERVELKSGYWRKPVSACSKGMRQRVSMARVLISSPSLLFLDEPTSGLDPAGAVLFRQLIQAERDRGATIFLTTHNMHDADLLCDRIALIADGRIKAIDTPARLKAQNGSGQVEVEYRLGEDIRTARLDYPDLARGLPFPHDAVIRVHSVEPTLEDVFIRYTGKGLGL